MEFADYTYKDLYVYLMLQNETAFRITMPKDDSVEKTDKIMIVTEYYDALYFGQKLSELSHDFCYSVPSEYSVFPFAYEFSTADMEKLAETLFPYRLYSILKQLMLWKNIGTIRKSSGPNTATMKLCRFARACCTLWKIIYTNN